MRDPSEPTAATSPEASARSPIGRLGPGELVGRYQIEELLGAGGMGVVYKALDPRMSRHVALKLLHGYRQLLPDAGEHETRLLREAQALARLSHPNVVAAYDVGSYDGAVFVAMELVSGESMHAWLERPRPRAEVLAILVGAGRGLAAAHAAGVLHRDFKPENVMVADDGRARVVDFGLARAAGEPDDPHGDLARPPSPDSLLSRELTEQGSLIGTAGYMAPEQLAGAAPDARADQFSFAATAFRALTGRKPFAGRRLDDYRAALLRGDRAPWPAHVPARVRCVIDRGLAQRPDDRYPTLAALVDQLERVARPRGRAGLAFAGGAVALAALAAVAIGARSGAAAEPAGCRVDPARFAGAWDPARRADVERAFRATGLARAGDAFALAAVRIDRWRGRWQDARNDACVASRDGGQSARVLALRSACLDDQLAGLRALVDVFAHADAALVDRAPAAALALERPEDCAAVPALLDAADRLPADPIARAAIGAIDTRLEGVYALQIAGRWQDGLARAQAILDDARRTAFAPAIARAGYRIGVLESRLGKSNAAEVSFRASLAAAADAHDDKQLAATAVDLVDGVISQQRFAEARGMLPYVDAAVRRAGDPRGLRADVLVDEGQVLAAGGAADTDAAIAKLTAAIDAYTKLDPDGGGVTYPMTVLGNLYLAGKDYPHARALLDRVVAISRAIYGPHHPWVLDALTSAAEADAEAGDRAAALAALADARAVAADLPDDPGDVAFIPAIEGEMWEREHDCARAEPLLREAIAAFTDAFGADDFQVTTVELHLGDCLREDGRAADALVQYRRAAASRRALGAAADQIAEADDAIRDAQRPAK